MIFDTIRILYQLSPRMMFVSEVGAIFKSFTPFVNIYMSARIIDELAGARSAKTLTVYVLITIIANLVITLINQVANQIVNREAKLLPEKISFMLSKVGLEMDYQNVEIVLLPKRVLEQPQYTMVPSTYLVTLQTHVLFH